MIDTYSELNEEVEITLNLRVKITKASYYKEMSEAELKAHVEVAKLELKNVLLQKVKDAYYNEQLSKEVNYEYEVFDRD